MSVPILDRRILDLSPTNLVLLQMENARTAKTNNSASMGMTVKGTTTP